MLHVDITGEPEFVDLMYLRHHARAAASGARIVHCCGFKSVPHDLGTYLTVGLLPQDGPVRVQAFLRGDSRLSGAASTRR